MPFGLPTEAVARINAVFARHPQIRQAIVYGSRAKGSFRPGSDLDLTLLGENLQPAILPALILELDDLLLPWMIDLSLFDHLDHAPLREHIQRVGKIFYDRAAADQ